MLTSASIPANPEIARLTPSLKTVEASRHGRNPAATLFPLVGAVCVFGLALLGGPTWAQIAIAVASVTLFFVQRVVFMAQDRARERMNTWAHLVRDSLLGLNGPLVDQHLVDRILRGSINENHPDLPTPNLWRSTTQTNVYGERHTDVVVISADGSIVLLASATGARSKAW